MLERIDQRSVHHYWDGAHQWEAATAGFAVDPAAEANRRIVDLEFAPRDSDGKVRFEADLRVLRPAGTHGSNGRALLVVPNRGLLGPLPFSLDIISAVGAAVDPAARPQPGDGFLLEQGWTIAWCGWQWDVLRPDGYLGLTAPLAAVEPGGWARVEFRPDAVEADHALGDSSALFRFTDNPTSDLDDPDAVLTVRTSPLGPKQEVPRKQWRFLGDTRIAVDGGFQPFHWYELVYRPAMAPVVGTGLLAYRDAGAWLRAEHDYVFGLGISQSGRFLRQFVYDGLNLDEGGRQVFDGLFTHVTGARRGEFNYRYGQPALTHPLNPGYGPPYDTTALLDRQRALGAVPKLMQSNSASEYWRGDGALQHQDARTGDDCPEDPDARVHLLSGLDHFATFALKTKLPVANPVHLLDPTPLFRALWVQLVEWVCDGVEPSPSCVPRRADGTAVERAEVLQTFHHVHLPDPEHLPYTPDIDPDSTVPFKLGEPMVALVSAVDGDGNEVAGIRLPAIAAPVAAYTGWNPRVPVDGLPDVLYEFAGSRLPLQSGRAAPARGDYEAQVREAAEALVKTRFLLARDVERTVAEAMQLYDAGG